MTLCDKKDFNEYLIRNREVMIRFGVKRIGLFGSFGRNEQTPESDLDLLVEFEPGKKNYDNYIDLAYFIEDTTNRKVDLLTRESLSPYLGSAILEETEFYEL